MTFIIFKPNLTGLAIGETQGEYYEFIYLTYNESSEYILIPEELGELTSIALSGEIKTTGTIKITIENKTIFDSTKIKKESINQSTSNKIFGSLTGKIIDEEKTDIKEEKTQEDKKFEEKPIKKEEKPKIDTSQETKIEEEEKEETNIEIPNEIKEEEITSEETYVEDTTTTTNEDQTEPQKPTQNETSELEIQEEIKNVTTEETSNNLTEIKNERNETTEEKKTEEIYENESTTPTTETIKEKIEFEDYCLETCSLKNLNKENYTIKIQIDNSSLILKKIKYRISNPKIQENITLEPKNITIKTEQGTAIIGESVNWTKKIYTQEPTSIRIELPEESRNIEILKIINNTKLPLEEEKQKINQITKIETEKPLYQRFSLTGNIIKEKEIQETLEIILPEENIKYEINYETEPPKKNETQITETLKQIYIYTNDELNYTNILSFTTLEREAKEKEIKLYHIIDNDKIETEFIGYDINNNSLIDYIEWTIPHLSSQTYELLIAEAGTQQNQTKRPTSTGKILNQWISPTNAYISNDLYSEETRNGESQDWYNFNFSIPEESEIIGIELLIEGNDPTWANQGVIASISSDSGNTFSEGIELRWPNVNDAIRIAGNSTFLWGMDWYPADLRNENFLLKLEKIGNDWNSLRIDSIAINLFYIELPPQEVKINLISPETRLNTIEIPKFKFNFTSETIQELNCSLILNGTNYWTNPTQNSTETPITLYNLNFGDYEWYITCSNNLNSFSSAKRIFTYSEYQINEEIKSPSSTGLLNNQWTNPISAYLSDDAYATEEKNGQTQDWYNFNFLQPNNSEITGIEVILEGNDATWANQGVSVTLSPNRGTTYSTERTTTWATGIDEIKTFGGLTDTWGINWTNENISNENFLIALTKTGKNNNLLNIDNIKIKIYFKEKVPPTNYSAKINIPKNSITDLSTGLNEGPLTTNASLKLQITHSNNSNLLNDSTAKIEFSKNEIKRNSLCQKLTNETSELSANYTCTIEMNFFDPPGEWTINASIMDFTNKYYENASEKITIGATSGFIISRTNLSWPKISPSSKNIEATNSIKLQNTGNLNQSIKIYSTDLIGRTNPLFKIPANSLTISDETGCNGTLMESETEKTITNLTLRTGNYLLDTGEGEKELFFCIKEIPANTTSQEYTTEGNSWIIKIFTALISIKRKKIKKEIEKLKKSGITEEEIIETINQETIQIPLEIFKKEIGALEAITKFLKENKNITFAEIARQLKRDQRTIWTAYKKSEEKYPTKFKKTKSETMPITIFQNQKLTILESVIKHLRKNGLKYSEIGALLNRNERNIWTINNRLKQK